MKYKTALLIGRFQPFHLGHLYLIKKALSVAEKIVIGIGSANIYDANNPLDWKTREKILKAVIYKENIDLRVSKIVPLDDFFNDEKWLKNVNNKIGGFDLVVGNNDWVNRIMEKGGFEVLRVPYYKRYLYEGEKIRKLLVEGKNWQKRVPPYLVKYIADNLTENVESVVLGGTFDHLHKGHRAMLDKAFTIGKRVTVGVATEELYKKKHLSDKIESFSVRKKSVRDYLNKRGWLKKAKIIAFSHFKGPLDKKKDVQAIVVSKQTLPNALRINALRDENRLKPIRTVVIEDVLSEDGKLISSERVRRGEIDREGKSYLRLFKKTLKLPEIMREHLRKPLGKVIRGSFKNQEGIAKKVVGLIKKLKPTVMIAVGDIISTSIEEAGLTAEIKVIDYRSRRLEIEKQKTPGKEYVNDPGTINKESVAGINKGIYDFLTTYEPNVVKIKGEEDLLALPAILLAPLGSVVLYGHWQLGVVVVEVNEKMKDKIVKIIGSFE